MAQSKAKWWEVYTDDEEKRVFVGKDGNSGLIRGKDKDTRDHFNWRTLEGLATDSGLTRAKVEGILQKYLKSGMVVQNDRGDKFGYWEKVAPQMGLPPAKTAVEADQDSRMDKASRKK